MPNPHREHPDYESLRPQALALRRAGLSRRQIRDRLHLHNNDILNRLLEGIPAPDWTRRPNAKDDLRARARELRGPGVIRLYLAWLKLLSAEPERIGYRLMIHSTADVAAAEHYWAALVGIEFGALLKTTIKKHNPKTVRKNVDDDYHGCLVIRVLQSADLYRRIEGWWYGIVLGAKRPG